MTAFTYTQVPELYASEAFHADGADAVTTLDAAEARMETALRIETEAAEVEYDDDAADYAHRAAVEYMRLVKQAQEDED